MSGHSKWAQIKRKKAATDAARGKVFTKYIRELTIAARAGGGDPEGNPRLRSAILAAKNVNMPASNIERAIKRGTGEVEGAHFEEVLYEGYAPGGVAMLVDTATDNRNRTVNDIRYILSKHGGSLAAAGSVAYLFKPRGVIVVARAAADEERLIEIALEAGADDVLATADHFEVLTPPPALDGVRDAIAARGIEVSHAEQTKVASTQVRVDERQAEALLRLVDALEDHDDVQKVHANFDIPDEVLARLSR